MRVLVTGGRWWNQKDATWSFLDAIHAETPISLLIHGAAVGADTLCRLWAEDRGIPLLGFPITKADWNRLGKAAGCIRNQTMLDEGLPDILVAFPGANGTKDMKSRARKAGLPILEYSDEPRDTE
jgi:hypothetical protein